jgi:hypothetical protein
MDVSEHLKRHGTRERQIVFAGNVVTAHEVRALAAARLRMSPASL